MTLLSSVSIILGPSARRGGAFSNSMPKLGMILLADGRWVLMHAQCVGVRFVPRRWRTASAGDWSS